jgi:hypothetical protein
MRPMPSPTSPAVRAAVLAAAFVVNLMIGLLIETLAAPDADPSRTAVVAPAVAVA